MSTYDEQELVRLATEITALRARCEAAELALKEERRFATLCTLLAGHTGTHYGVGGAGWNAEPVSPAGGQRTNSPTGGEHEGCALFSRVPALGVYRDCEGEGHYLCRECVHKEKLSGEEEP